MSYFKYLILALSVLSFGTFSVENCVYDGQYKDKNDAKFFNNSIEQGVKLSESLCHDAINLNNASNNTSSRNLLKDWYIAIKKDAMGLINLDETSGVTAQIQNFNKNYFNLDSTTLSVNTPSNGTVNFYQNNDNIVSLKLGECQSEYQANCRDVVEEFKQALELPWYNIKQNTSARAAAELNLKSLAWQRYFEERRSQTILELAINTWSYQDELKKREPIEPPNYQWIVLHPSLVLQQSPDEVDGSQLKEALAVEWFGINFWDLNVPLGASVVSTYADRAYGKDFTTGLMIHISNDYSIGITHIGGENNLFISVDLLKFFEDKNSNFKKYLSSI